MSAGLGSSHNALTTQQKLDARTAVGAVGTLPEITAAFNAGTTAEKSAFRGAVQGDGIARADAVKNTVTGTHLEMRRVIEDGQPVIWWRPGAAAGFWGYAISPTDKFTG